jgi:hypothetical protein
MTVPTFVPGAELVAFAKFAHAVTLEVIPATVPVPNPIKVGYLDEPVAPQPGAHAIVVGYDTSESPDGFYRYNDATTADETDRWSWKAILAVECWGAKHREMMHALKKAHRRLDLQATHLGAIDAEWRGLNGDTINLTGLVGTHNEGRSRQLFWVGWREAVETRSGSAVDLAIFDVTINDDLIIDGAQTDLDP